MTQRDFHQVLFSDQSKTPKSVYKTLLVENNEKKNLCVCVCHTVNWLGLGGGRGSRGRKGRGREAK